MEAITNWFNGDMDYNVGVAIYATLPIKKLNILKRFNRGRNNHNMSTLVKELRQFNNTPITPKQPKNPTPKQPTTQNTINIEVERKQQVNTSLQRAFNGVRLGDLPAELRTKFVKAQTIFHEMIELKFALNDLPAKAQQTALKIQLKICDLDEQRDAIWLQLNHWKTHKTILEVPENDFSKLDKFQLDKMRRNFRSSVSTINKRIDKFYTQLEAAKTIKHQQLIEAKINRSEKRVFTHEMNIKRINALIKE